MAAMSQAPQLVSLFAADEIHARVRQLAAEINASYDKASTPHLVSVLKGGFVFLVDLMRALSRPITIDFVAVTSYEAQTCSSHAPVILKDLEQAITGRDVLVVEDIVDTGRTLSWLLNRLRAGQPRSLRTVALLNKPSRRTVSVELDHVGFAIDEQFVVGYGLDYAERYRYLPYIGLLDSDERQREAPRSNVVRSSTGGSVKP